MSSHGTRGIMTNDRRFLTMNANDIFASGRFFTGCNYWAGHAGMMMWRDWRPDVVEREFAALAANGIRVLRVFPLWSDFQPISKIRGWAGHFGGWGGPDGREVRGNGVDAEMVGRFRAMCDMAGRHGLRLVVGLITGWMSGRLFVPPAFEGVNVITDGDAMMWQVRYVRRLVRELRNHAAIAAWDLGNECNCLGESSQGEFWAWMNAIASAVRLEDVTRPVVSGMHSLSTDQLARCPIRLNAELTDVLTVHPYPFYTPGCSAEPFDTMRNELHPSAEALLYSGLGGRPCFVEEAGNLGGGVASRERTAANIRCALYSAWANDVRGYLWWCNADQEHLDFPPYDWTANERELGLFDRDGRAKPVLEEMRAFADFLDSLPFHRLPPRRIDATVVVPEREDGWKAAFGTFLLARQAGFDVCFAGAEGELPDSDFYILVSSTGDDAYTHSAWRRLVAKAEAGATLLVVKGASLRLTGLAETAGIEVDWMTKTPSVRRVRLLSEPERPFEVADAGGTCRILAKGAEILAEDAETGDAMMTSHVCGRGRILVVNAPVDVSAIDRTDCFAGDSLNPAYLVYREAMRIAGVRRVVEKGDAPTVGLTEHAFGDGRTLVVAVNYGPQPVRCPITVAGHVASVYRGRVENDAIDFDGNDVAVFEVRQFSARNTPPRTSHHGNLGHKILNIMFSCPSHTRKSGREI